MAAFFPYLVAIFAVSAYALISPMVKKVGELPPFSYIAISSFILFTVCGAVAYFFEKDKVLEAADRINWPWLVAMSATNIIGYIGYLWAINRVPVVHYEMLIFISPIIGGLFAVYLLNEPFHLRYIPALGFMLLGLLIAIKPWDVE